MNKTEMAQILGYCNINEDTYLLVKGLLSGASYEQIYEYIDNNREILNIPLDKKLTTKKTCQKYYTKITGKKIEEELKKEEQEKEKEQFLLSLTEMRKYAHKQIKEENYKVILDMLNGCSYQDSVKKWGVCSIAESTCKDYIRQIKKSIQRTEEDWYDKIGIYGIYINTVLVYVGMTMSSFQHRFKEHRKNFNNDDLYIYKLMRKAKEAGQTITMKPLVVVDRDFSLKEVQAMEFALITHLQPIGNIKGRIMPYYGGIKKC